MKNKATKYDIYNYFLSKDHDLHKALALCYYAYAWGLVFLRREIAPFRFIKSDIGPIDPDLLYCEAERPVLDPRLSDYLYFVWNKYRDNSGKDLLERAKNHPPYMKAKEEISKRSMRKFFKRFETLSRFREK